MKKFLKIISSVEVIFPAFIVIMSMNVAIQRGLYVMAWMLGLVIMGIAILIVVYQGEEKLKSDELLFFAGMFTMISSILFLA